MQRTPIGLLSGTRHVAAAAALCFAGSASAVTLIDFESLPQNTTVSVQYLGMGVKFSSPGNPTQPQIEDFSGNSTTGNLLADFSVVGGIRLDAEFGPQVTAVSAIVYANPSYFITMMAYDAASNLIGSAKSAGGSYNQGVLSLSGIGDIARVTWDTGSTVAAVGIDDLTFTQAVPEPGTWALLAAGLLALIVLRRSR